MPHVASPLSRSSGPVLIRFLVALVLAVFLLGTPALGRPALAQNATAIEVTVERPVWKLHERIVVTGRLTSGGAPVPGAEVRVGVDGYLDETLYKGTTAADGSYRVEFWVEDWWGFGGHSLTAQFVGDDNFAPSQLTTMFQVAPDAVAPVALTVDPLPPDPVVPGQHVTVTGTLRNDRNEPAEGHSMVAVVDAGTDARAFAKVGADARWSLDIVVPSTPGEWSRTFPAYHIPIIFEGDWWLAPAQQEVVLTLARQPDEAMSTPTPTPSAVATPTASAPSATPTGSAAPGHGPVGSLGGSTAQTAVTALQPFSWWPGWAPAWAASPVFLIAVAGGFALLIGAAFISHARRPR